MEPSLLNCRSRKDFEFLYDMFSANIYEVLHSISESEEIAEKILSDTFLAIRKLQFTYDQKYLDIFTTLLSIAIQLYCDEMNVGYPRKVIYHKLKKKWGLQAHKNLHEH